MTEQCSSDHLNPEAIIVKAGEIYHSGKCDDAIGLLLAATRQIPDDRRLPIKLAELMLDSEQFADALTVLQKFPGLDNDFDVLSLKGLCEAGLGELRDAAQLAERLLTMDQDRPAGFHLKGLVAYQLNRADDAETNFKQALKLDPDCGEAYKSLGVIKKMRGDQTTALELFENGFKCTPTIRQVVLAYHNEVVAQADFERAERNFRSAIERHPANLRLRYLYIDILLRCQKQLQAMAAIEDCLKEFGSDDGLLEAALQIRNQLGETQPANFRNNDQCLSLCMIVKNEEAHLARCLASVKALVDEIIIVDTGSGDKTIKIAQAFGAKVFKYGWDNDFAQARNFSLSKASGDWVLILDADEVISTMDHMRLCALMQKDAAAIAYSITTRNYTRQANLVGWTANQGNYSAEETGNGWYPSHKVRLFPNDPRIRFSYPIHELVEPSLKKIGIRIESCAVPVHHYGKLNGQRNDQKALAYYELGMKKLAALGDNAVALRELAVQAAGLEKFDEAADLWQRLLKLDPNCAEAYVNMGTACWNLGNFNQAAHCAKKAVSIEPEFKEAQFNLALSELFLGNTRETVEILEQLTRIHPRYLSACFILAAGYACESQWQKAQKRFDQVRRTLSDFEFHVAIRELAQRMTAAGQQRFADMLNRFDRIVEPA